MSPMTSIEQIKVRTYIESKNFLLLLSCIDPTRAESISTKRTSPKAPISPIDSNCFVSFMILSSSRFSFCRIGCKFVSTRESHISPGKGGTSLSVPSWHFYIFGELGMPQLVVFKLLRYLHNSSLTFLVSGHSRDKHRRCLYCDSRTGKGQRYWHFGELVRLRRE